MRTWKSYPQAHSPTTTSRLRKPISRNVNQQPEEQARNPELAMCPGRRPPTPADGGQAPVVAIAERQRLPGSLNDVVRNVRASCFATCATRQRLPVLRERRCHNDGLCGRARRASVRPARPPGGAEEAANGDAATPAAHTTVCASMRPLFVCTAGSLGAPRPFSSTSDDRAGPTRHPAAPATHEPPPKARLEGREQVATAARCADAGRMCGNPAPVRRAIGSAPASSTPADSADDDERQQPPLSSASGPARRFERE